VRELPSEASPFCRPKLPSCSTEPALTKIRNRPKVVRGVVSPKRD
jgi:hypothetical protein